MPRISRDRVVGKTEEELDELTCIICQNIFNDPVVTNCCRQTFCRQCITHWVRDNNTCPNDRKELSVESLSTAPRVLFNLLDLLLIKCEYHSNGCQTVLTSDLMTKHEEICDKNPIDCDSCRKLHGKVQTLANQVERLTREINLVKSAQSSTNTHSPQRLIEMSRKNLHDMKCYKSHKISDQQFQFIIDCCKRAIQTRDSFNEIAKLIEHKMDENEKNRKFGHRPKWSAIVTNDDIENEIHQVTSFLLNNDNKKYVEIRFHKIVCCLSRDRIINNS